MTVDAHNTPTKSLFRLLWPSARPYSRLAALSALCMVADGVLTALRPWPVKVVIDRALLQRHTRVPIVGPLLNHAHVDPMRLVLCACAVSIFIGLGTGLSTYYYTRTMGEVSQRFVFRLRRVVFAHMQRLSLRFHDSRRTGDLLTRLTSDMGSMQDLIAQGVHQLISNGVLLGSMIGMMFWLNWRFALVALSASPMLFFAVFRYTGKIRSASRAARSSDGSLASIAQETLSSIRTVQGLAQESQQDLRYNAQSETSLQGHLDMVRYQSWLAPLVDALAASGVAMVMWYGARSVLRGDLTPGDVVVFFAYVTNLYAPMRALSKLSFIFSKAGVGAERVCDVLLAQSEVGDLPTARPAPRLSGTVEFRNVTFGYDPARPVLSNVDLLIRAGETVAIVGATGAGKSTLACLMLRFYDPDRGAVLFDGVDARQYQVQTLREQIGLVLQDSLLFNGSIRDNIAFSRPDATDDEIAAAARTANSEEFILQMKDGYASLVAEGGVSLSGGQRQRLAIARAILREAPVLILDEPTSGLDVAAERKVMHAIEQSVRGRTAILITHRMSTVRFADRIVVLDGGTIVEEGSHASLVHSDGPYAQLWEVAMAKPQKAETLES